MKTHNYNMELMVPMQNNKEIIFNEDLSVLDNFCNSSIISFIDELPEKAYCGQKYIVENGTNKDSICYSLDGSKGWQFIKPFNGMILFIQKNNDFFIFEESIWKALNLKSSSANNANNSADLVNENEIFKSINAEFEPNNEHNHLYLYLNGDCTISLANLKLRQLTIIIKQNFQATYKLHWPPNILWKDKTTHVITATPNSIDIIRLYRLIESNHYIGEVIGQDYKF